MVEFSRNHQLMIEDCSNDEWFINEIDYLYIESEESKEVKIIKIEKELEENGNFVFIQVNYQDFRDNTIIKLSKVNKIIDKRPPVALIDEEGFKRLKNEKPNEDFFKNTNNSVS